MQGMTGFGQSDRLETYCQFCGIALYPDEIGGEINGDFIDFTQRKIGHIDSVFCTECWSKMMGISNGGMHDAIQMRKQLFGNGDNK